MIAVLEVNLRTGMTSLLPTGVTWHSPLTSGGAESTCDRQGVLKLSFNAADRRRAQVNLTFEESQGFTFNVGDSATNNGYGQFQRLYIISFYSSVLAFAPNVIVFLHLDYISLY